MKIGVMNELIIDRILDIGAYLEDENKESVLLPKKELSDEDKVGKTVNVFLYKDSKGRLISTKREPYIFIGEVKKLEVMALSNIGAFLNIGLERDVLLPHREMIYKPKVGDKVLVTLYEDKSNRLAATMRIYKSLKTCDKFKPGDIVRCSIYEKKDFGYLAAVEDKYFGLIPMNETYKKYELGEELECRVVKIREDKKIDLSAQNYNYMKIDDDAQKVLDEIKRKSGVLDINEKTDVDIIKERFQMSKSSFKRAVGRLLKNGEIIIDNEIIRLK